MRVPLWVALAGALGITAWGTGGAAQADDGPVTTVDYLTESLTHAACQGRAGDLALTGAKAKEVKRLARQVVAEQEEFDRDLVLLALNHKLPLQQNQVSGQKLCESRLKGLRGDAFDRALLHLLIDDVEQWIDLSQRTARKGDPAERDLATRMLPTLRQRLQDAKRLLKLVE